MYKTYIFAVLKTLAKNCSFLIECRQQDYTKQNEKSEEYIAGICSELFVEDGNELQSVSPLSNTLLQQTFVNTFSFCIAHIVLHLT